MAEGGAPLRVEVTLARGDRSWDLRMASQARRIGLFGPSGCGKSTLLRVLAGLEPEAAGVVEVQGETFQAPGRFVPPWERRVGWVPQDALLFPHASVSENLRWGGGSLAEAEAVAAALSLTPLLDRRPRNLSGGERQRVALGRALLSAPRLLLLDEAFSALDPALKASVQGALQRWLDTRTCGLLLVSHDRGDLSALCEEVWEARSEGDLRRA